TVGHAVQSLVRRQRVYVVYVIARLGVIGRTRVAAQAPGLLGGYRAIGEERVARDTAQGIQVQVIHTGEIADTGVQRLQIRRLAGLLDLLLDVTRVRCHLVGVDPGADLAQRRAQLRLLLALRHQLGEGQRGAHQQPDDRERDHELNQRETARAHGLTSQWWFSA